MASRTERIITEHLEDTVDVETQKDMLLVGCVRKHPLQVELSDFHELAVTDGVITAERLERAKHHWSILTTNLVADARTDTTAVTALINMGVRCDEGAIVGGGRQLGGS